MPLFTVTCTTCTARLAVRDTAVIGQILECPKCGSMVQIVPPKGWQPPPAPPAPTPPTSPPKSTPQAPPASQGLAAKAPSPASTSERGRGSLPLAPRRAEGSAPVVAVPHSATDPKPP